MRPASETHYESGCGEFLAIPCAPRQLPDPNAVVSDKTNTIPPWTPIETPGGLASGGSVTDKMQSAHGAFYLRIASDSGSAPLVVNHTAFVRCSESTPKRVWPMLATPGGFVAGAGLTHAAPIVTRSKRVC